MYVGGPQNFGDAGAPPHLDESLVDPRETHPSRTCYRADSRSSPNRMELGLIVKVTMRMRSAT